MQSLGDVTRWVSIGEGEVLEFLDKRARPVRVHVNTSRKAEIMIQLAQEEPKFLALVEGRDVLHFFVPGEYSIMHRTPDADVHILTADGDAQHRVNMAEEVYTSLHERRARDPALERMQYEMQRNFDRRMAAVTAQMERLIDVNTKTGVGSSGAPVSEPPLEGADAGTGVGKAGDDDSGNSGE